MAVRMILSWSSVLICALALAADEADKSQKAPAPPDSKKQEAAVKWGKGVATEFLQITADPDRDKDVLPRAEVAPLVGPELKESLVKEGYPFDLRFRTLCEYKSAEITGEEVSPDVNEVVFSGVLRDNRRSEDWEGTFKLRVTKYPSTGEWRVRSFVVTEHEKQTK
jgi:hypothetical protein